MLDISFIFDGWFAPVIVGVLMIAAQVFETVTDWLEK